MEQALRETRNCSLDVTGVNEMRWTGKGRLDRNDRIILYSGSDEHHVRGVGIILTPSQALHVIEWRPVNERIITARLAKVTVVQVYAPIDAATDVEKDIFYVRLQEVLEGTPSSDIKLVMGDFSAKLDGNRPRMYSTVSPHSSTDVINDNGQWLLLMNSTTNLSFENMFLPHRKIHTMTWTSPNGCIRNEIQSRLHLC